MSALGQKQTFALLNAMSARGQKRTAIALFDHFIGLSHQRWWHNESKRFRGLEVNDEIELRRLQDGKIGGLLALQYPCNVSADLPVRIGNTGPITDQTAFEGVYAELINGGQTILRRESNDATATRIEIWIGRDHQCANLLAQQRSKSSVQLGIVAGFCDKKLSAKIRCRPFDVSYLICCRRKIGVDDSTEANDVGYRLVQNAEPLLLHVVAQNGGSSGVTTWSVEALDKTEFDRITTRVEDNRDSRTRLLCSASRRIPTGGGQHGYASLHEFFGKHCQPIVIAARPPIFNIDVATVDETTFSQSFMKCIEFADRIFGGAPAQITNDRCGRLLRARGDRQYRRGASK